MNFRDVSRQRFIGKFKVRKSRLTGTWGRFSSGFNATLSTAGGGWLSEGCYELDQGLLVMMIENHNSA
jgi:hypothetical protein